MLKKIIIGATLLSCGQLLQAQCSPNEQYADSASGVWPTIEEGLPCAFADDPSGYNATIDVKTITDTTISYLGLSIQALVRAIRITSITGLPDGFTFSPNEEVWENGGQRPQFTPVQGCVKLSAPAQAVSLLSMTNPNGIDYDLKVFVDLQIDSVIPDNQLLKPLYGRWLSEINSDPLKPVEVNGYQIRVRSISGPCFPSVNSTADVKNNRVRLNGVYPNPSSDISNIHFTSLRAGAFTLNLYNATGALVQQQTIPVTAGENTATLNTFGLAGGLYHFTLQNQQDLMHGSLIRSND
jgi:hypothetical protein